MTTPVTQDDIVTGAIKFLKTKPDVLAVLGVMQNPPGPMLFAYNNWTEMEGTQQTCAIITNDGGWTGPNQHNTLRFPRLGLNIWSDPIRDGGNNAIKPGEVMRRTEAAFEVFDKHLHRVAGDTQMWGQIRTVSCVRLTEPMTYRLPDGDGIVRLQAFYAVTQG